MSNRVIAVMAIGQKYQSLLKKSKFMFEWYAKKCNANLVIIKKPLDPGMKHNILMQKMLFAKYVEDADEAVLLDLDMLISPKAKNIFDFITKEKHLYACIDPYGTDRFIKTAKRLWKKENIEGITHNQYFENAGLKKTHHSETYYALNGGAYLLKPKEVAEPLEDLYYRCTEKYPLTPFALRHEECMMAYYAQSKQVFEPLSLSFNYQILFDLFGTDLYYEIPGLVDTVYRKVMRRLMITQSLKKPFLHKSYQFHPVYIKYIESKLLTESILHFAGGYAIPEYFLQPHFYSDATL